MPWSQIMWSLSCIYLKEYLFILSYDSSKRKYGSLFNKSTEGNAEFTSVSYSRPYKPTKVPTEEEKK